MPPHTPPQKLAFNEVIASSTIFYNNPFMESEFSRFIEVKSQEIRSSNIGHGHINKDDVLQFILNEADALKRVLGILHLSQEKFLRIVSLIRQLQGTFDTEWNIERIENEIRLNSGDNIFAYRIVGILMNGYQDAGLLEHLPQFYRERLKLTTLNEYTTDEELFFRLKDKYVAKYNSMKGYAIEEVIRCEIEQTGQTYAKGKTALVDTTVDWMIPDLINPQIIIMSTYQETTASNQSTKARDMMKCYEAIQHRNMQMNENRIFINFVDGGGWLARRADLKRLYSACHYFLNLKNIGQLQDIINSVMTPHDS